MFHTHCAVVAVRLQILCGLQQHIFIIFFKQLIQVLLVCGLLQQHTITVRKQQEHTNTVRLLQTPTWSHYSDCNNSVLQISRWSEKCKTKCGRWTGFIVRKASAEQLFSWHCPFRALKRSFHVLLSLQMFSFRPPRVFYVENLPNRAKIPRNLTAVLVFHVSCCMKGASTM